MRVEFEGSTYEFPDDATHSEIGRALSAYSLSAKGKGSAPSAQRAGLTPPAPETSLGGVVTSFGQGLAEGLTTEIPGMIGGAVEFAGSYLPEELKVVEDVGRGIKEWSEKKRTEWYGPEKKRQGLERIVYEGTKMLAPSVIPGGVISTGIRVLKGVGKLVQMGKAAQLAGDTMKAAELFQAANTAAKSANNIASASVAGLFGLSQAQQTVDTAEKRAALLDIQGDVEGARKAREAGSGWAPLATGAIEAGGEYLGTKYLGKLFRLDEASVAKRGAKTLVKDFLKTLGVEVGTEMGQQYGEASVEKVSGVRPDVDPLEEALDVIGPTAFMTLLTGGMAGAVNRMRRQDDPIDLTKYQDDKKQEESTADLTPEIAKALDDYKKQQERPSTAREAAEVLLGADAVQEEDARQALRRRGLFVPDEVPMKSAEESAEALEENIAWETPTEDQLQALAGAMAFRQPHLGEKGKVEEDVRVAGGKKEEIDMAAHEAATSPLNDLPEPTDAQKDVGNYRKGHVSVHGMNIAIENPAGSERVGVDKDGTPWSVTMQHHYGYLNRTEGKDGDQIDVIVGPNPESDKAYVVDQIDPKTGKFDEHKSLVGFASEEDARKGYLANYEQGWQGLGEITEMPMDQFKEWIKGGRKTRPVTYKEGKDAGKVRSDEGPVLLGQKGGVAVEKPAAPANLGQKAAVRQRPGEGGQDIQRPEGAERGAGNRTGLKEEPAPATKAFVENKIRTLGSIEAVNAFYAGQDIVSDYARTMAPKILAKGGVPSGQKGKAETVLEKPQAEIPPAPITEAKAGGPLPNEHPKDKVYSALMKKGIPVGPNLYELSDKQVSPSLRKKLSLRGRPEETDSFYLKPKADVTSNPYDTGWILKDKRQDFAERNQQEQYAVRGPAEESVDQPGMLRRAWDEFIFQAQDRFHYLNKAKIEAERRDSRELPEEQDAYLAETRYHGMAAASIDDFEEQGVTPLQELLRTADISLEEADRYLHARHAREANARLKKISPSREEVDRLIAEARYRLERVKGERQYIRSMNPDDYAGTKRYRQTEKEMAEIHAEINRLKNYVPVKDNTALSGMSDKEADRILSETERKPNASYYRELGMRVDAINKETRELLLEAGLETPETIAAWEAAYEHYVPLHREGKGTTLPRRGRGFDIRGKQKMRAGSTREAVNILAHVVAQREAAIVRAEKAKVGRAFLEFAQNNPGPWKIDKPEMTPSYNADGFVTYQANPIGYMLADNVFSVRVDGEDHHITFDENSVEGMRIASALKNLSAADAGSLVRIMSKMTRFLAMVNTSLNPEFIISNFFRDIQTAAYNMSDSQADAIRMKAIRQVGSSFKGIRDYQKGNRGTEWAGWFNLFRHAGGQTGWIDSYRDIEDREKKLIAAIEDMKPGKIRLVKRGMKHALDFISDMNGAVENAIRLSVFKNLVESGMTEAKAARIAKELTVNFNRRGNRGPALNAFYMFFNASIQGSSRLIHAAAKSPKVRKLMIATVGFAAMLDIGNRLLGGDDDDGEYLYDKVPNWVKERNLIIMLPGKAGYLQIPLPWGYNVFHVIGQAAGEVLTKKNNKAVDSAIRVASATWSSFNPVGGESSILQVLSPTISDPLAQWAENKDWSGRKLRPSTSSFAPKPSSQTYWSSVRAPSKWAAEKLNELTGGDEVRPGKIDISPEAIDLVIDTFTGGAGKFISNLISTPIKAARGDSVETYEVPFLRRVYGKPGKQALTQEYYENMDAIRLVDRQLSHYKSDREKLREIREESGAEIRLIAREKAAAEAMKDLRERRKRAEKIEDREARVERIKAIDERMEAVMTKFNMHYHRIMDKGAER